MKTKVLFVVQGEGRGHMTQAISLKQILETSDFEICCVLVGRSERREIPKFFLDKFSNIPVHGIQSPNFVTANNRGIRIWPTITYNFRNARKFMKSAVFLKEMIEKHEADLVLNFYEPTVGLYHLTQKKMRDIPMICVAHQYLTGHSRFRFPKGKWMDRLMLRMYTSFTSAGCENHFGLSFYPLPEESNSRITVVPPLLRHEIREVEIKHGEYFLCYLVNAGYIDDLFEWSKQHTENVLHVFTDAKQEEETKQYSPNFYVHKLNDKLFLKYMAGCKGVVSSAGFESVCEALWMGKPVFMVPVEGHFEQLCNAVDALRAGAGIYDRKFQLNRFIDWLPTWTSKAAVFREWQDKSSEIFIREIHNILHYNSDERKTGKSF